VLDSKTAIDAVQQRFFSADGLVPPDQFLRMLDYVDMEAPAFGRPVPHSNGILRLQDDTLHETSHVVPLPPQPDAPVVATNVVDMAAHPAQAKLRREGPDLDPRYAAADVASSFSHAADGHEAVGNAAAGLDLQSLPSATSPLLGPAPFPTLYSTFVDTNSGGFSPLPGGLPPTPVADEVVDDGCRRGVKRAREEGGLGQSGAQSIAGDSLPGDILAVPATDFAAELSSLVGMQEDLSAAEHTLLGNLATADSNLASEFPGDHAAFSTQRYGHDSLHSGSNGDSDPAGLRLVDLDFE
jgi:hypothetical protein